MCSTNSCSAQGEKKVTDKAFQVFLDKFRTFTPPLNYKKTPGNNPVMTKEEAIRFLHKTEEDLYSTEIDYGYDTDEISYYEEEHTAGCDFKYRLNDSIYIPVEFKQAIEIIDKSLKEHELPIMVGVQHPYYSQNQWKNKCSGNTPNVTNHYIIIRGKKYDSSKKQYYYLFYEVGTTSTDNGKSMGNKLYINDTNNLIEGKTANQTTYTGNYYIVTEVRKNTGQIY